MNIKEPSGKKCVLRGAFNYYMDRILPFFDPTSLRGQFLCLEREQKKTTFFDPRLL